jgi:hypothetical protein
MKQVKKIIEDFRKSGKTVEEYFAENELSEYEKVIIRYVADSESPVVTVSEEIIEEEPIISTSEEEIIEEEKGKGRR